MEYIGSKARASIDAMRGSHNPETNVDIYLYCLYHKAITDIGVCIICEDNTVLYYL